MYSYPEGVLVFIIFLEYIALTRACLFRLHWTSTRLSPESELCCPWQRPYYTMNGIWAHPSSAIAGARGAVS